MNRRWAYVAIILWFSGLCFIVVGAQQRIWWVLIAGLLLFIAAWRAEAMIDDDGEG